MIAELVEEMIAASCRRAFVQASSALQLASPFDWNYVESEAVVSHRAFQIQERKRAWVLAA